VLFSIPLLALVFWIFTVRGDWMVGGRDPGLYLGEGVRLAREGTFTPAPQGVLLKLSQEDRALFLRNRFGFNEVLPVLPVAEDGAAERPFFFPLTAVSVAGLALDGGADWAARFGSVQGILTLLAGMAFLSASGARLLPVVVFATAFLAQPVVLYHFGLSLSEFGEVFLLFGLGLALSRRLPESPLWLVSLFALGVANRLSFLMFGGVLLFLSIWRDLGVEAKSTLFRRLALGWAGLLCGAAACFWLAGPALKRLDGQVTEIAFAACLLVFGSCLAVGLPLMRTLRARLPMGWLVFLAIPPLVVLGSLKSGGLERMGNSLAGTWGFVGPLVILIGLIGLALWLRAAEKQDGPDPLLPTALAISALVIFARSDIATDFPWASRRYLLAFSPALALGVAHLAGLLKSPRLVVGSCMLLLSINPLFGFASRPRSFHFPREYQGLSFLLRDVARNIPRDASVICDHFVWGTPLRMIHGVDVLDGDWLRENKTINRGLAALTGQGDVYVLTSVPSGSEWVDLVSPTASLVKEWPPFSYSVMKSHDRVRAFEAVGKSKVFRLYRVTKSP
jgi:hypothetical protein